MLAAIVWLLATSILEATPGESKMSGFSSGDSGKGIPRSLALAATSLHAAKLDANEIMMYVSNNGAFARNEGDTSGYFNGLFYPSGSDTPLVYSAGLWLSATVNGSLRVAMAEYASEFAPGPFGGDNVADSSMFRVRRISTSDTLDPSTDWISWPNGWGAPVDDEGEPLLTGEQSLFAIFNDGDAARHRVRGGSTKPLGAEVKVYAFEYARSGLLDQVVWLKYVIVNRSPDDWHDFIAGVWADPDIGVSADDMGGSDSLRSLVYCYSLEGDGDLPAGFVPVVGLQLLDSPSLASTGRASSSANVLFNYFRSQSAKMTRDISLGLATDGTEYVDPTTGAPTRYRYGGDPRSGKGWLDSNGKGDRAIVLSSGPTEVPSGHSCCLVVAVLAASGGSNVEALDSLFDLADGTRDYFELGNTGLDVIDDQRRGFVRSVGFSPREQTWMKGMDWGGSAFDGGIGWAGELWGSSFSREDCADVIFEFHPRDGQKAYRFAAADDAFEFAGYVRVPFECKRAADSARLAVLFVDNDGNGVWAPRSDTSAQADMLLVTASAYSDEPLDSYANLSLPNDALSADLMYAVSLDVRPSYERTNIREGQTLSISVSSGDDKPHISSVDFSDIPVGLRGSELVSIRNTYMSAKSLSVATSNPDEFRVSTRTLRLAKGDTARIEVIYEPLDTGFDSASLTIEISDFNMPAIVLPVIGHAVTWPLEGDFVPNGTLDLYDVTSLIRYLYGLPEVPPAGVRIDLNSSGEIDLADAVALINRIFLGL
jgi:hypothetical protein